MVGLGPFGDSIRVTGDMTLKETSVDDVSPLTGQRPATVDTALHPLWGFVDLDFDAAGIPGVAIEEPVTSDATAMVFLSGTPPDSRDPIFPGVLAQRTTVETVLLIGTLGNERTVRVSLDGPGIVLRVAATSQTGFGGHWGPWGIHETGAGWFCASAVTRGGV